MRTCEYGGDVHSQDLVAVWHGTDDPTYVCGYHLDRVASTWTGGNQ